MGKTVSVDWNYWFENDKMNEGNLNDENASRSFAGTHASES
jgi:hypothetical protein